MLPLYVSRLCKRYEQQECMPQDLSAVLSNGRSGPSSTVFRHSFLEGSSQVIIPLVNMHESSPRKASAGIFSSIPVT